MRGESMANIYSDDFGTDVESVRRRVRNSAHAQRIRSMLVAASLSAFGMVAVAATLLTQLI